MAIFNHYKTPLYMLCCAGALSTLVSCDLNCDVVSFQVLEKTPEDHYIVLLGMNDPLNSAQVCTINPDKHKGDLAVGKLYHGYIESFTSDMGAAFPVSKVQPDFSGKTITVPSHQSFSADVTGFCFERREQSQNKAKKLIVFEYDIQVTSKKTANSAVVNVTNEQGDVIYSNYPLNLSGEVASSLIEGMRYKANFKINGAKGCYLDSVTPLERENTHQQEVIEKPQEKPVSHNRVSVPQTVYERSIVRA